jgi:hypothetical protein
MREVFSASEFTPTQWDTAQDKAEFANRLLDFMLTGFVAGRFTNKLYKRLSSCFGHIAHFDLNGFAETWFDGPASIAAFVNQITKWPCFGDPTYTYSDVERAIQREVLRLNIVQQVNDKAAAVTRERELALLHSLETKYRNVIQMPAPRPAVYDGPAEQLPLIA